MNPQIHDQFLAFSWREAKRRITAWALDDEQGFDAIIALLHELGLVDDAAQQRVKARRLRPDEKGYDEPGGAT